MPRARAVLLDLDGTLVDSQPGIIASCSAALRALGRDPGEAPGVKLVIGPPLEDILQALLRTYGDDRIDEAVAAYRQHYGESGIFGSEPYPGIGVALQEMRRAGLRIYLATSKREVFARRILENLKLAACFDGIYGSVPGGKLDHKPELLAHILSEEPICASRSLMVGGIAGTTSSGLTRSRCAVLARFGDMAAERSLKRPAPTNWRNEVLISLAPFYPC